MTLKIDDLRFSYGDREILHGLTFDIPAGCLAAILGENGSGKTTLLKNINRLLSPQSGAVSIDGLTVGDMSGREIARHFGYMPQRQQAAYSTVLDAVLLGRQARNGGPTGERDLEKIEDILRLVRLESLAMRPTVELSGGELQKVILARALAQEPKVLLLDEPINHLDPVNQIEVMSLLHAVTHDLDIVSLLVTHDLNSAFRFADTFILLKEGRILAAGGRDAITPEVIQEAFHIDVELGEVGGVSVVVPRLQGARPHQHLTESGRFQEHVHEVDEHVYDHEHEQGEKGHE